MANALTFRLVGTNQQRHHIMNGLHAGIPICCVAYFVTVHFPGGFRRWRRRNTEIMRALGGHWRRRGVGKKRRYTWVLPHGAKKPEYIPCPRCLRAKNFVRVHLCTKRCPQPLSRCERGHNHGAK